MLARDLAHECEPQPDAAGALARAREPVERLEDPLALGFRHARAAVAAAEQRAPARALPDRNVDRRTAAVAPCVLEQVADHPAQQARIPFHPRRLALEHRIDAHGLGVRDLTTSSSTRAAAQAAGVSGAFDVAELHAQFSHEVLIVGDALGLNGNTRINPSGGPLAANPVMSAGLIRIGEVAQRIMTGDAGRGVAHATSGPCLQQNLVAVLDGGKA